MESPNLGPGCFLLLALLLPAPTKLGDRHGDTQRRSWALSVRYGLFGDWTAGSTDGWTPVGMDRCTNHGSAQPSHAEARCNRSIACRFRHCPSSADALHVGTDGAPLPVRHPTDEHVLTGSPLSALLGGQLGCKPRRVIGRLSSSFSIEGLPCQTRRPFNCIPQRFNSFGEASSHFLCFPAERGQGSVVQLLLAGPSPSRAAGSCPVQFPRTLDPPSSLVRRPRRYGLD
ncbi:hypothetical protein B0I37DRAFT_373197 [Chaetomium sp. MPI-CAGE-AT-0009]|nr:hypothetical protein B0I37DRAFT_373197 [Chaetomium sp. MPI-CAGE-AT-0009]